MVSAMRPEKATLTALFWVHMSLDVSCRVLSMSPRRPLDALRSRCDRRMLSLENLAQDSGTDTL